MLSSCLVTASQSCPRPWGPSHPSPSSPSPTTACERCPQPWEPCPACSASISLGTCWRPCPLRSEAWAAWPSSIWPPIGCRASLAPSPGCGPCGSAFCTATSWLRCPPAWPASRCSPGSTCGTTSSGTCPLSCWTPPLCACKETPWAGPLLTPPAPQPIFPSPGTPMVPEMPRLLLTSDLDSFAVTPQGCSVTLACGVRLQFPAGATAAPVTIRYRLWLPEPRLVPLGPHDALLSGVLELQPHGVAFQQEVGLWLLFVPPRARRFREVVVRTLSDDSWSDLETHLEEEAPQVGAARAVWEGPALLRPAGPNRVLLRPRQRLWAHCQVPHFSWFLVVSRPVSDACLVPPEGALLCSSGHAGVRVTFPAGATEEPRHVRMQVVHVGRRELPALLGEPEAAASPLLCLSQSGPSSFLRPVTVQLPLPPGITGLSLDRSCLHLLHRAAPAATWDDITAQVALELTHLYARFQVTRFSWYWLWYTTKTCVGGLARKAWERLRLHRVNLIALQRRRDPEQVLLQCLPRNKVDATLRRLLERYRGPEPSDTVEMFEGEKFFAAFERGIDIDADRPDCVEGRVCFVFYSHLKNLKEVYVTTALDRRARAVRGQVSFYRGEVPEVVPEEAEAARQKRGTAALWMATLPIKLPRLRGCEGPAQGAGLSLAPLNLGDAETGFLTQSNLLNVARRLGPDWPAVALHLGLPYRELQRIRHEFRDDLDGQIRHMLFSWAERQAGQLGAVGRLVQALEQSDRRDVAEEVQAVLELGRRKYQEGLQHTSLAPRNLASPDRSPSPSLEPAQTETPDFGLDPEAPAFKSSLRVNKVTPPPV
ncbi:p53-induced death domain-containing protein 1 isoform 5-T5 [Dama dama]|uniref:p53-induced death domain-containing protein 1 isoform X5 n=1 Tax=Dama dama TaxID=30532 RepID=UPI002A359F58|nr:p53-induced death domain-containing protein 1 isoform X5 [Dama dama]